MHTEKEGRVYLVLRQNRISRGWTQVFVAKQIGLKKAAVQMLETGQRKPSYDVLVKLLDLFDYSDPRLLFAPTDKSINER